MRARFAPVASNRIHIGRRHQHDLRGDRWSFEALYQVHTHIWRDPRLPPEKSAPALSLPSGVIPELKRHILRFKRRGAQTIPDKNAA